MLIALLLAVIAEQANQPRARIQELSGRMGLGPPTAHLSPLQRRLLWLFDTQRLDVAISTAEIIVSYLLRNTHRGTFVGMLGYIGGPDFSTRLIEEDLDEVEWAKGKGARNFYTTLIRRNRWWDDDDTPLPARSAYDTLIPWIARCVKTAIDAPRRFSYRGEPIQAAMDRGTYGQPFHHRYHTTDKVITGHEVRTDRDLTRLIQKLPAIRDWYAADPGVDISGLTLGQAIYRANAWHRQLETTRRAEVRGSHKGVLAELDNGWKIVELDAADLRDESTAMGHCVGESRVYRDGIRRGVTRILSVRDADGRSLFTLELGLTERGVYGSEWDLKQFKGDGNRIPGLSRGATANRARIGNERIMAAMRAGDSLVDMDELRNVEKVLYWLHKSNISAFSTSDTDLLAYKAIVDNEPS